MTRKQVTDWILVTLREAAWAPLSVFGLYLLGLVFGVYDRYPLMDVPTHFLGGVAITYFFRFAIRNSQAIFGEIPFPVETHAQIWLDKNKHSLFGRASCLWAA
jgi:hypothetical protein